MRGPHSGKTITPSSLRLIPAGAGTTILRVSSSIARRAHPRRCGDHEEVFLWTSGMGGSSPQVRGPPLPPLFCEGDIRLIPAGAGTTSPRTGTRVSGQAHPRRCGDHDWDGGESDHVGGSSPQVRGPHRGHETAFSGGGLIPAGAGTTYRYPRGDPGS